MGHAAIIHHRQIADAPFVLKLYLGVIDKPEEFRQQAVALVFCKALNSGCNQWTNVERLPAGIGMADHHHERLNQIFDAMDADRSGEVTPLEFIDHMLGTQMEHETVSALFRKMDTDGNGSISRAEFLAGFDRLMAEWAQPGPAVGSQEEAAAAAATFAAVDADNSGKLDLEELLSALAAAGGDVADRAEVEALFKRLDVNGDGEP